MFENIDFSKLKLIIWDLDDTFWRGTLSEQKITEVPANIELVQLLADRGIISSICSKNDQDQVFLELRRLCIDDYFVFNSIDWTPKGARISQMINDMGLQAKHCLFIDDNIVNLKEASHYCSELNIASPEIIDSLHSFYSSLPVSDIKHKRLKQYKVLETKCVAKKSASNNLDFLLQSNTVVEINHDCDSHVDRILELINRTNQLNYTKIRCTKEELCVLLADKSYETGYVTVRDKYGDYGIVGFYAIKHHVLKHFLFSCRTIGQGVEQYVYAILGHPVLDVVGKVINEVTTGPAPEWINQQNPELQQKRRTEIKGKIIFKGACDMGILSSYICANDVIEEFGYIGKLRQNLIEHHNHSINYLQFSALNNYERKKITEELLFNDDEMYSSCIYDKDVTLLFLSTMIEPNLGIYKNKQTGKKIAFGEYSYPLTDSSLWEQYMSGEIFNAQNHFTYEWLQKFSNAYEFCGRLSPLQILENFKVLKRKMNPNAVICFLLGSEIPYHKNDKVNYIGRESIYKEINKLIREWAKYDHNIIYIDFNDYINGQLDFTDNINHFQRRVYFEAANKVNEIIHQLTGQHSSQRGKVYLKYSSAAGWLAQKGLFNTLLWKIVRLPYSFIKPVLGLKK